MCVEGSFTIVTVKVEGEGGVGPGWGTFAVTVIEVGMTYSGLQYGGNSFVSSCCLLVVCGIGCSSLFGEWLFGSECWIGRLASGESFSSC